MTTKIFDGKKITIRELRLSDTKNVRKFQNFINSLIEEDVKITRNKKVGLKEEISWLKSRLKEKQKNRMIILVAENKEIIVGITRIELMRGRQGHVGGFGINVRKDYRRIGLGKYLMAETIKLAKKELRPKPKIIRLSVFAKNKPAIRFYKKFGFKKVALIPKQFQYKGKLQDEIIMLLYL